MSFAAKYLMLLDTDPRGDDSPDFNYPSQKLNAEMISLDNENGVGDLRGDCLTNLRNLPWTPFTAYGVGGPVGGKIISLFTTVWGHRMSHRKWSNAVQPSAAHSHYCRARPPLFLSLGPYLQWNSPGTRCFPEFVCRVLCI